jgi:hypothetical protein
VLGGFVVAALYSFSFAQSYPELDTMAIFSLPENPSTNEILSAIAVAGGVSFVSIGLPDDTIVGLYISPGEPVNVGELFDTLARSQGLCSGLNNGVLVVYRAESGCDDRLEPDVVNAAGEEGTVTPILDDVVLADPVSLDSVKPVDELPKTLGYRFRVMQIDDSRAARLGIDWRALLTTANALAGSVPPVLAGFMASPDLDGFVSALESQGVATRLEDMRLEGVSGEPVSFNRGGSINVSLVGGGDATVSRTFQFGLGFTVTGLVVPGGVRVLYTFDDSSPSNVSDASNVQISSTSNQSSTILECGGSTLLAALSTERFSHDGAGLPGVSRVPVLGYAAGQSSDDQRRSMIAVTLEVSCDL